MYLLVLGAAPLPGSVIDPDRMLKADLLTAGMELDVAARDWVTRCDGLLKYADDDGIVPINPMRGEAQAEERPVALLRDAFTEAGADFNQSVVTRLIAATGSKAGTAGAS